MKSLFSLATFMTFATLPAMAAPTSTLPNPPPQMVTLPNGQQGGPVTQKASPFGGLGDQGVAWVGPWHSDGTVRLYLFTSENPGSSGSFALTFPTAIMGQGLRPICNATAQAVSSDYAFGYQVPFWPMASFQLSDYWLEGPQVVQTFVWQTTEPLWSWSTYQVDIICGIKQSQ